MENPSLYLVCHKIITLTGLNVTLQRSSVFRGDFMAEMYVDQLVAVIEEISERWVMH